MKHIESLDGVRGIAVLCVVAFHFFPHEGSGLLRPLLASGWAGVDLFFVLSGYLITRVLLEHRGAKNYYRDFYMRRALRLYPLFYFIFLGALVLTPALRIHWRLKHVALVLQCANLVLPPDYSLGMIGPFKFNHLWSLSVEEQFYLLWPWMVGAKLSRENLQRICVVGMIAALLLRLLLLQEHVNPWWIYHSLPTRMDSLLAGALLALMPLPSLKLARVIGAAALLLWTGVVWQGHSLFFLSRPIQGIGFTALALLFASGLVMCLYPGTIVHRVSSLSVLRFFGKYSYGIYLWHYLFSKQFGLLRDSVRLHIAIPFVASAVTFALILLCSTTLALVSYRLIERPFLKMKKRFEYRSPQTSESRAAKDAILA